MMEPLPIFAIVGRSLWFVVANLFSLFRLTWLPCAALVAAGWGLAYAVVSQSPGLTFEKLDENDLFTYAAYTSLVLQGLALSVVAVQVHRIILFGDRRPNVYFAFPFGRTELLYVVMGALTYVALFVLLLIVILGVVAVVVAVSAGASVTEALAQQFSHYMAAGKDAEPSAVFVAGAVFATIFVYVLIIWIMLRLTVWPPAVVANNRLALGEALGLTKGRVWALLGLMIASSLVFIPIFFALGFWAYSAGLEGGENFFLVTALEGKVKVLLDGPVDPDLVVFDFAAQLLVTCYTVAILSFAYKALKGFDAERPIGEQGEDNDPILHMK
jgi:hypothetical protein